MKWLFFILLAANLGLAAFIYISDRLPNLDALIVGQQINADQIQIVAPRPIPPPAPVAPGPAPPVAVQPAEPAVCIEWGSFGAAEFSKAQAALDMLAPGERIQTIEVGVSSSYWVYIPPLRSKAEMDSKVNELKGLGVTDYSPIPESGRWRYAIALGVFRNEDGAKNQLASLRKKGVRSAQIGEREQRVTQKVFIVRNPTQTQSGQLANLKSEHPGSDLRTVDCPLP